MSKATIFRSQSRELDQKVSRRLGTCEARLKREKRSRPRRSLFLYVTCL